TPTAAAELAVPDRMALAADLAQSGARLTGALTRVTQSVRLRLDRAAAALPDLPSMIGTARQRLDDRGERLALALPRLVAAKRAQAREVAARLVHPREIIAARRHSLALLGQRLAAPAPGLLRENRLRLGALAARLEALSYHATLARGFVMVATPSGDPVTTRRDAGSKRHLVLHFGDGTLGVRPEADRAPPAQTSLDL
ncbi:exodeoxyribonuclease VII large subunit, partial [Acidiphilium sp. PM]